MRTPAEIDWARLAAFIDGEGCIGLVKFRDVYTVLKVTIVNTDKRLIDWCMEHFGGSCSVRKTRSNEHKTPYAWYVTSRAAANVVRGCYPYFLIKKEQATVAIEFLGTVNSSISNFSELTASRREHREKLLAKMHELNKKGK